MNISGKAQLSLLENPFLSARSRRFGLCWKILAGGRRNPSLGSRWCCSETAGVAYALRLHVLDGTVSERGVAKDSLCRGAVRGGCALGELLPIAPALSLRGGSTAAAAAARAIRQGRRWRRKAGRVAGGGSHDPQVGSWLFP